MSCTFFLHINVVQIGLPYLGSSGSKESACKGGDLGSIPGLGRSPGGGHDNPFQNSCLEKPHGQRSLAGYSPWDCKESDTTKKLRIAQLSPNNISFGDKTSIT